MKYHKLINGNIYIKKCCHTCKFNFGVCAAGGGKYNYGDTIDDENYVCMNYDISFHEFCNLAEYQLDHYEKYLY